MQIPSATTVLLYGNTVVLVKELAHGLVIRANLVADFPDRGAWKLAESFQDLFLYLLVSQSQFGASRPQSINSSD